MRGAVEVVVVGKVGRALHEWPLVAMRWVVAMVIRVVAMRWMGVVVMGMRWVLMVEI